MFVVHGTRKVLDRCSATAGTAATAADQSTTQLGSWYVTQLFWKPHVALFVNELTLLPILTPFAPAATLLDRFPAVLAEVLDAHRVPTTFVERELAEMADHRLTKTANRRVVGVMNEFSFLAGV